MVQHIINRIKKIRQQKALILMYHQVSERRSDPWEMAVHPNHFQAQLEYLRKHFQVISIAELADGLSSHKLKKTIALTFDDGFKDNYSNAAPLLDYHDMPATFYVPTTPVQHESVYWWDRLQDIILNTGVLPSSLSMQIGEQCLSFVFRTDRVLHKRLVSQIRGWNHHLPIPNERVALFVTLWHHLKPLPYTKQNEALAAIDEWAGNPEPAGDPALTMNVREIQTLAQNRLFAVGAHSVHHSLLSKQDVCEQAFEIKESKSKIEAWLGKPVDGFSYPYGNYNQVTQALLKDAGFKYAVSAESKSVTEDDDPFALPRMHVKNWCVYEFASKLNEMVNE